VGFFKDKFSQVQCSFTCIPLADSSHMLCSYVSCIITTQSLINLIAASVEMELILQLDLTGLSFLPKLQLQIKSRERLS
jgi:hypothetical protein